jgi:hypothetical protein
MHDDGTLKYSDGIKLHTKSSRLAQPANILIHVKNFLCHLEQIDNQSVNLFLNLGYIHKDPCHLGNLPLGPILGSLDSGSWANGY